MTGPREILEIPGDPDLLGLLVDVIPVPCAVTVRETGRVLAANRHIRSLLGHDAPPGSRELYASDFHADPNLRARLVGMLEHDSVIRDVDYEALREDGQHVSCLASFQAATWQGMNVILACLIDIADRKEAERALRESEEKFREIAQNTSDVIWHLDANLVVTEVGGGQRLLDWLGRSPLVGTPALMCFTPETGAHLLNGLKERQEKERQGGSTTAARYEGELLNSRGERLWVEMTVYPHRNEAGRMIGLFGVMRDISERKRAENALRQSETLFRQMFDAAPIAMLLVEPDTGRIFNANGAAAHFYGTDLAVLRGRALSDLSLPAEAGDETEGAPGPSLLDRLRDCVARGDSVVEDTHRLMTGETRRVSAYVGPVDVPLSEGGVRHLLTVSLFDITDRDRAAQELERRNTALRDFTTAVSHDLQEPLRMVSGYLGLLERRLGDRLDADERDFIGYAVDGAQRMNAMIQGLLVYARLDTRAVPHLPVDLSEIMNTVLAMLRSQMAEHDASVSIARPLPSVMADPNQMVSLFQNLIGNAIKYRARDRRCEITVDWQARDGWAELSVCDTGIGIAPTQHERVFGVFQRLRALPDEDGTGMGLAICRRIVDRHGGRIWIEPQAGAGTTFRFTLPLSE